MRSENVRVLFVETDPGTRRAVEFYIQGFCRQGLEFKTISSREDAADRLRENWDVILVHTHTNDLSKMDLLETVKSRMSGVPLIDLGQTHNQLITSGAETSIDDFLPRMTVSANSVLRSIGHLIERRQLFEKTVETLQKSITEVSHTDPLTGLWNQNYLTERIAEEFMSWQRYKYPLTIALAEILGFDNMEEKHGYEVTDHVSRKSGKLITEAKRTTDYAGRFGNNGFCMVFPKTPVPSALIGVERVRDSIQRALFHGKSTENFTVEVCFGVAQLSEEMTQPVELINAARKAIKTAAAAGRGHIEVHYGAQAAQAAGARVLVVDDHASILDLCCDVFQANGYQTTAARSGRDAQRAVAGAKFDLYVVDLQLPDMDGRELIRKICQSHGPTAPVIVVSGEPDATLNELRGLGVDHLLRKPFTPESLIKAAEELLKPQRSSDAA